MQRTVTYAFSYSQSLNSALSSISYKKTLWIIMLIYKMTNNNSIWINHMLNFIYFKISFKQKAHWATSPEKPVQINKHIYLYFTIDKQKK